MGSGSRFVLALCCCGVRPRAIDKETSVECFGTRETLDRSLPRVGERGARTHGPSYLPPGDSGARVMYSVKGVLRLKIH